MKKSDKKTVEDVFKSKLQSLDEIQKKNEWYFYGALLGLFLVLQSVVSAARYSGNLLSEEFYMRKYNFLYTKV